jgi:translation elongation factor EF-G
VSCTLKLLLTVKTEFKVEANVALLLSLTHKTITNPMEAEFRYVKQTGGKGQFAHYTIMRLEPNSGKVLNLLILSKAVQFLQNLFLQLEIGLKQL